MGTSFTFINEINMKRSHFSYGCSAIHSLRLYAINDMLDLPRETDNETHAKVVEQFPNLCYHDDGEGYYVGITRKDFNRDWPLDAQIWVGSVKGLYRELQRVNAHMLANNYEGDAKTVLQSFFKAFQEIEYDPEENEQYVVIFFS
jgi:hypothetical protein